MACGDSNSFDHLKPNDIWTITTNAKVDNNASLPIRYALPFSNSRRTANYTTFSDELLSSESQSFMQALHSRDRPSMQSGPSQPLLNGVSRTKADAMHATPPSASSASYPYPYLRRRSASHNDLALPSKATGESGHTESQSEGNTDLARFSNGNARPRVDTQFQSELLSEPVSPTTWEDFVAIGFGDSWEPVKLTFTPETLPTSPRYRSSVEREALAGELDITAYRSRIKVTPHESPHMIISEGLSEVEDHFISFAEDGQLDSPTSRSWPSFAILRLANTLPSPSTAEDAISVLLITVATSRQAVSPNAQPTPVPSRSPLPRSGSATSRLSSSFQDIMGTFRRSSSSGPSNDKRKSLFAISGKILGNETAQSKDPSSSSDQQNQVYSSPATENAVSSISRTPAKLLSTQEKMPAKVYDEAAMTDIIVVDRTRTTEWCYKAEGASHIVFSYIGTSSAFAGKVIRVRKSKALLYDDALQAAWRDDFMPRLVPESLRIAMHEVELKKDWLDKLVVEAEQLRPKWRKVDIWSTSEHPAATSKAYLMEDLMTRNGLSAQDKLVCIEIKVCIGTRFSGWS